LFSGAIASVSDATAASTLADAFAPDEPETPLRGAPAHHADDELSLDHVFRGNSAPPGAVSQDDFSFDQFFAEDAPEDAKPREASAGAPSAPDDIAQFNAWLNGLKKT
jgi:hypothetical protein